MAFSDNVNMIETLSSASARASSGYVKHEDGIITLPFTEVIILKTHMRQIVSM